MLKTMEQLEADIRKLRGALAEVLDCIEFTANPERPEEDNKGTLVGPRADAAITKACEALDETL